MTVYSEHGDVLGIVVDTGPGHRNRYLSVGYNNLMGKKYIGYHMTKDEAAEAVREWHRD